MEASTVNQKKSVPVVAIGAGVLAGVTTTGVTYTAKNNSFIKSLPKDIFTLGEEKATRLQKAVANSDEYGKLFSKAAEMGSIMKAHETANQPAFDAARKAFEAVKDQVETEVAPLRKAFEAVKKTNNQTEIRNTRKALREALTEARKNFGYQKTKTAFDKASTEHLKFKSKFGNLAKETKEASVSIAKKINLRTAAIIGGIAAIGITAAALIVKSIKNNKTKAASIE